ncbi:hypothetical protein [Pseudomonas sp. EA_5y_Pfl2_R50]|uniref:hypothetical protein n=1 Tax=Pseudomonas sp. EA_5y_Pfl2_R50 TaxID=3088691 RepID=UPI0030D9A983
MLHRNISNGFVRSLMIGLSAIGATGCSVAQQDSFTLVTELPPGFEVKGEAVYAPRTGETCKVPPKNGKNHLGSKAFKQELSKKAQRAQFTIQLSRTEGGCPLVLKRFDYEVDAKYGAARLNLGRDYTSIAFEDATANNQLSLSPRLLERECEWLFRTIGLNRYITKILKCKAIGASQHENDSATSPLSRTQLAGKTLTVKFSLSKEERPYMGDTWIEFPEGWKRCMGEYLNDQYGFCRGNTKDFKSFKMPDGRECTVYPNCTE